MLNSVVMLEDSVREHPGKVAVIFGSTRLSYAQLSEKVNQLANGLRELGIQAGDLVLLACPNRVEFPVAYYALVKMGAIAVPVSILSKRDEFAYYLTDTRAKAFLCSQNTEELSLAEEAWAAYGEVESCEHFILITEDLAAPSPYGEGWTLHSLMQGQPMVFEPEQTRSDETAVILYTSGTTGEPKGAELTHLNLVSTAMNFRDAVCATPDDVHLIALPLSHCYSQSAQMNAGFLAGAALVIMSRFDAEKALSTMAEEGITLFCGVPTMYWALLNKTVAREHDIERISNAFRAGVSGGGPLPVEVLQAVEEKLKIRILEAYGLTETSAATTFNRLGRPRRIGSIGTPHWGIQVRVVDEAMQDVPVGQPGELVIRGPCTMKGYCNQPEATAEAFRGGWFHSGDVATRDEDGYFYIVDRLKDMIIRGGYNVYPREVEDRLMEHPDISLAAVVGVPDEEHGEEVRAYVVLKDGRASDPKSITAWSKAKMAAYKYPREVKIVDSLPLSPTGKILKRELRESIARETSKASPPAAGEG